MDIIVSIIIISAIGLPAVIKYIKNLRSKQKIISFACSECNAQVAVLLEKDSFSSSQALSSEDKKKILSLTIDEWKEWKSKYDKVLSIAKKYTFTFDTYLQEEFSYLLSKKSVNKSLFSTVSRKRELLVESMSLSELNLVLAESDENWRKRASRIQKANEIKRNNKDGYKTYCEIRHVANPTTIDIIRDKISIEEFQKSYDRSIIYNGWEDRQKDFCDKYHSLCSDHRENDGRFTYEVNYSHITKSGSATNSKFKIWQGFISSFCFEHEEIQPTHMINTKHNLPEFKGQERFFIQSVYQEIYNIIDDLSQEYNLVPLVVFVNTSRHNWPKDTYQYHYKEIKSLLDSNGYDCCNLEDLHEINSETQYDVVILMDAITNTEDLKNNCRLIAEYFSRSVPMIGYYTWIKEYSSDEVIKFYENPTFPIPTPAPLPSPKPINSEVFDIAFVKELFSKVCKDSYYSYIAITNTLIGEAGGAGETKVKWLRNPKLYKIKCDRSDKNRLKISYSIDAGNSYSNMELNGNSFSIDDVAKLTYNLFKIMDVWDDFKENGEQAINYINTRGFLAKH